MSNTFIIIGTGLAGYMLAKEWRKLDKDTPLLMITKDDGAFYSKPQLSNGLLHDKTAEMLAISSAEEMAAQLQAEILTHTTVTRIDVETQQVWVNDRAFAYDHLALAGGAKPIQLTLAGDAVSQLLSVNNLLDYAEFRTWLIDKKRIAVLGAGLVGCEFANDLLNAHCDVEVVSFDAQPLPALVPPALGVALQLTLEKAGVRWHLGSAVQAVNAVSGGLELTLSDESTLTVDGVLSAVGLHTDLQLAQSAGLTTDQGIVVNEFLQTSVDNIYALGDCAQLQGQVRRYVAPLLQSARALAKNLAAERQPIKLPIMPIVVKTPCCPVVTVPPAADVTGEWIIEGEGADYKALFYDQQQQLQGFALTGACTREKMTLLKTMQQQSVTL